MTVPVLRFDGLSGDPSPESVTTHGIHHVNLDRLVGSRLLIQAASGAGKSRLLRSMLEQTHGKVQHIVIDPEGEYASLREKFDYVLAGEGGDVAATPKTAKLLCRRVMELQASTILDLYALQHQERREFVRIFLTELMMLPRAYWRSLLVVIDEAHKFAPQGESDVQSTQAVIDLCSQGRKRGYMAALATQRISKIHKDAAADLANRLIGRTDLDDDLGFDKEGRQALKRLDAGVFYAYGPALGTMVSLVKVSDILTSHPTPGKVAPPPPPAPAKIRAMLASLRDLPHEAEEEERTIVALEAKVKELQRQGKVRGGGAPTEAELTAALAPRVERAMREALPAMHGMYRDQMRRVRDGITTALGNLTTAQNLADVELSRGPLEVDAAPPQPHRTVVRMKPETNAGKPHPSPDSRAMVHEAVGGDATLKKGQSRMLQVLASRWPNDASLSQLGMLARLATKGGTFSMYFNDMHRRGLVEENTTDRWRITPTGFRAIGIKPGSAQPTTTAEVLALHAGILKDSSRRMLESLMTLYPRGMSRHYLGEAVNQTVGGGTFSNHVNTLKRADLVIEKGGQLYASTTLMEPGK